MRSFCRGQSTILRHVPVALLCLVDTFMRTHNTSEGGALFYLAAVLHLCLSLVVRWYFVCSGVLITRPVDFNDYLLLFMNCTTVVSCKNYGCCFCVVWRWCFQRILHPYEKQAVFIFCVRVSLSYAMLVLLAVCGPAVGRISKYIVCCVVLLVGLRVYNCRVQQ